MKIFQAALLCFLLTNAGFGQKAQQTTGVEKKNADQSSSMNSSCQGMMKQHQKMMDEMQQMDKQLQAKVAAMNSATGDQKVVAIAAAVNELAKQRHEMFARMDQMQSGMMSHMASHMQSGDKQSMANCPMMGQGMGMMQGKRATGDNTGQKK